MIETRRLWSSVLLLNMKQSTHPEPQPAGKSRVSVAGIIRAVLIFMAWAGVVPFILMFMSIVLETWRWVQLGGAIFRIDLPILEVWTAQLAICLYMWRAVHLLCCA